MTQSKTPITPTSETRSRFAELVAHLENIGWRQDSKGDPECADEGAARAADAILELERELQQANETIATLQERLKIHETGHIAWRHSKQVKAGSMNFQVVKTDNEKLFVLSEFSITVKGLEPENANDE